jgi:murein DD-endopeptidase MepM/ murein hydrolase activator NlpD
LRAGLQGGRTLRRSVSLLVVVILSLALWGLGVAVVPVQGKTLQELNDQLTTNQQKLDQLKQNIDKAEQTKSAALAQVEALDQKIVTLQADLDKVSAQRDVAADRLASTQKELDRLTVELEKTKIRLQKAEADLGTQQDAINGRAASLYKKGGADVSGFLEVLFTTRSLTDLVNRVDLLSSIAAQENRILTQIKTLKVQVTTDKQSLERDQASAVKVAAAQKEQTGALDTLVKQRASTLHELDSARSDKQAVADQAEANKQSWTAQEDDLLAESKKIEDQLRAVGTEPVVVNGRGFVRPVPGGVGSVFGMRLHPIFHVWKMHTGWDFHAGYGESIHAAAAGTVVSAGWMGGYGQAVIISHGGGLSTLYAHQSQLLVSVGQKVGKGQVIGKVGSTGFSTGPHLHFEVRVNGSPVNPSGYL